MKGSEIRRLIESYDHDGVFDDESATRDLKENDVLHVDSVRTLVILADAVRKLDIWGLVDGQYKSAATWILKFEPQKSACEDVEELLFLRPEHVLQLVKRIYTDWSKGIEDDLTR